MPTRPAASVGAEVQAAADILAVFHSELPTFRHAALAAAIRQLADSHGTTPRRVIETWVPGAVTEVC